MVLGCTHYPLLQGVLGYVMGEGVNLVSSADETAKDVFRVLTEHDLLAPSGNQAKYQFFATGDEQEFESVGAAIFRTRSYQSAASRKKEH